MTNAQRKRLTALCESYHVEFDESHYMRYPDDAWMMPGWVEGWVGGSEQNGKTIFVGVSPEGDSHS